MQAVSTLLDNIRREIQKNGVLPFARFMELALYCPDYGYYETKKDIGRGGDFYTSVSAGELFGQLLACQFAKWLEKLRSANHETRIVEGGAHDGRLAADILNWLQLRRPDLFSEIEYVILEPSPRRQDWQKATLKNFPNVRWHSRFDASTLQRFNGIIFANELLDAFPVHRFGWNAQKKQWFEWGVTADGDKFVWARLENSEFRIPNSELESVLPDSYTVETSPAAKTWWRAAARALAHGKLLTFDYGFTDDEWFSPARTRGTLRAYFRHHVTNDLLANPGEQDLTAHVNFSAIRQAGEDAGLATEFFGSQAHFLTEILAAATKQNSFGDWSAKQARQFQTLTHPEHLGRAFHALVQSRRSS
jgi:SAM-dependent MidA family methyltransferase